MKPLFLAAICYLRQARGHIAQQLAVRNESLCSRGLILFRPAYHFQWLILRLTSPPPFLSLKAISMSFFILGISRPSSLGSTRGLDRQFFATLPGPNARNPIPPKAV
jgi:hypothetical protein